MTADSINTFSFLADMNPILVVLIILWSLVWKGLALWKSAALRQKWWFIALLVINTLGILEIIYYFLVSRNYEMEVVEEK